MVMQADKNIFKDNEIILEPSYPLKYSKDVIAMTETDPELLNGVYREISEKLGIETALQLHQLFKGQQISFPSRFLNPAMIHKCILQEFDGTNIRMLAVKYGYSEKTIRRILREQGSKKTMKERGI